MLRYLSLVCAEHLTTVETLQDMFTVTQRGDDHQRALSCRLKPYQNTFMTTEETQEPKLKLHYFIIKA